MEDFIELWLMFGYCVYWIGLIVSTIVLDMTPLQGCGIGLVAFLVWFVILRIMIRINE